MPPTYGNYESCLKSSSPAPVLLAIRDSVPAAWCHLTMTGWYTGWSHRREGELALRP